MTQFNMQGQYVNQQYIAGRDLNIAAPLSLTATEQRRNRNAMLSKVRSRWITGILDLSLYQTAPIELKFHEQTDAVVNPWKHAVEPPNRLAPSPAGSSITRAFDDAGGELLILGEPGAGKTTLLLSLTRDLLDRAAQNETYFMPVVFNLSSWAVKRSSLTNWLVEELNSRYQVPHKLGRSWVTDNQILPLLDGLDEVPKEHQAACIDAINTYRHEHGMVPIVVCSRKADYLAHTTRLALRNAVMVQPLTPAQVDAYLLNAGGQLEAVRMMLWNDPSLREMATSPLMLSILALTYSGRPVGDLYKEGVPVTRQQVFADYVERMLHRREMNTPYTSQQKVYWLSWLAQKMTQTSQTEFYLERMQPTWLLEPRLYTIYNNIVPRLLGGLLGGLVGGLLDVLFMRIYYGLYDAVNPTDSFAMRGLLSNVLISGLYYILLGVVIGVVFSGRKTKAKSTKGIAGISGAAAQPAVEVKQQKTGRPDGLLGGTTHLWLVSIWKQQKTAWLGGLLGFLLGGFVGWWVGQQTVFGLTGELIFALTDGLLCGWFGLWLYRKSSSWFIAGCLGLLFGGLYGSIYGVRIITVLLPGMGESGIPTISDSILYIVGDGLIGLLIAILICILLGERDSEIKPAEVVAWSWRSVWQNIKKIEHLKYGLLFGLAFGVTFGLMIGVRFGVIGGITVAIISALIILHLTGILCGLAFWLIRILYSGFSSQMLDQRDITIPNLGIKRSRRNGILAGLIFGLTFILIAGLGFELIFRRLNSPLFELPAFELPGFLVIMSLGTLYSLLLGALLGGGFAYFQHYGLRLFLYYRGYVPWLYHRFLDSASEHILLYKVGGGYIFIHRLLLEYFASLSGTSLPYEEKVEQTQVRLPGVCICRQPYTTGASFCTNCGRSIQEQLPAMQLLHVATSVPTYAVPPNSSKTRLRLFWVTLALVSALFFTTVAGAFSAGITALKDPTDDPIVLAVYQYYSAVESQDYVSAFKVTDPGKVNYVNICKAPIRTPYSYTQLIHNCTQTPLMQNYYTQAGQKVDNSYGKLEAFFTVSVSLAPPGQGFGTRRTAIVSVQEERGGRLLGNFPLCLAQEASGWKIILIDFV